MLRTAPPAGRFLYGDIALLSEDDDENGSEGSGSDERTNNSAAFRLSSSSPSAFHIKVNRKRKLCGGVGGGGGITVGTGMLGRLAPPGTNHPGEVRQRTAANARERDRTNSVNTAFTALRTLIPTEPADRYRATAAKLCGHWWFDVKIRKLFPHDDLNMCKVRPDVRVEMMIYCGSVQIQQDCDYLLLMPVHSFMTSLLSSITQWISCLWFVLTGSCQRSRHYVWPAATSVIWETSCSWAKGSTTDNRATLHHLRSSMSTPPPAEDPTNRLSQSTSVLSASATRGKWWAKQLSVKVENRVQLWKKNLWDPVTKTRSK